MTATDTPGTGEIVTLDLSDPDVVDVIAKALYRRRRLFVRAWSKVTGRGWWRYDARQLLRQAAAAGKQGQA